MTYSFQASAAFFDHLVAQMRAEGVSCAITSGMACVALGLAAATKDCDVLCSLDGTDKFLRVLAGTSSGGAECHYRGRISPPLDPRWHRGGWTSHFEWPQPDDPLHLDVFGLAPRGSIRWEAELRGAYVGLQTLAEMKRTDRDKDWPFVNGIGILMLEAGDVRGWLHLYDPESITRLLEKLPCPSEMIHVRPLLQLAVEGDRRLAGALYAERLLWKALDSVRMKVYQRAVRPYVVAVRRNVPRGALDLLHEHEVRVRCAEEHLAKSPMQVYGIERMIEEARHEVGQFVLPEFLTWLPNVRANFSSLMG